jgi:hypothetical protein
MKPPTGDSKEYILMSKTVIKHPLTNEPLPVIVEDGKIIAVVIAIEQFQALVKLLEIMKAEDTQEGVHLTTSQVFQHAVQKGLEAIQQGKVRPWREAIADL